MQIDVKPGRVIYTTNHGDWRLDISEERFEIIPIMTGTLLYSSGINLDHLAELISEAKADLVANRGIAWSSV